MVVQYLLVKLVLDIQDFIKDKDDKRKIGKDIIIKNKYLCTILFVIGISFVSVILTVIIWIISDIF